MTAWTNSSLRRPSEVFERGSFADPCGAFVQIIERYVLTPGEPIAASGMRRDYFTLQVSNIDWVDDDDGSPQKPKVTISFEGPVSTLRERLTGLDGEPLSAAETDVSFRLQTPLDAADAQGVVSVTNRVTGDFILELNEDATDVLKFIRAGRRYGEQDSDESRYTVHIELDGEEFVTYEKSTFLVYNTDGNLLRNQSLIPSGVEL
jgi:hypothetical protein